MPKRTKQFKVQKKGGFPHTFHNPKNIYSSFEL